MQRRNGRFACLVGWAATLATPGALADEQMTERGRYLVSFGGCNDCHTPGYRLGKADADRFLGGSDVAFELPGQGAFIGSNLTPDKRTGIGDWSGEQIVTAIRTGIRPDGRVLATIMPWHAFANLTDEDASAIAAYLKSLPAIDHDVPGPFKPGEKVTTFMLRTLPPGETAAAMPK